MTGAEIVVLGLKMLVLMLDAGFGMAAFVILGAGILAVKDVRRMELKRQREEAELRIMISFLCAILCGIIAMILFGLLLMPWWA